MSQNTGRYTVPQSKSDADEGQMVEARIVDGSASVINGAYGDLSTYMMNAADAALLAGDNQTKILTNTTGFKGVEVSAVDTIATGTAIIVVVSTTNADNAAVAAAGNAMDTELDVPTGALNQNIAVLTNQNPTATFIYDGSTTIKTIAVRGNAAAAGQIAVRAVS